MCVFCDIAAHKMKAHIVYETEKTITVLDIEPVNEGHVLIIPEKHVDSIVDLTDDYVLEMAEVSRKLIHVFSESYHAPGYGIMQNGGSNCDSGHFHLHVFPRFSNDGFDWIYPEGIKEVSENVALRLKKGLENL